MLSILRNMRQGAEANVLVCVRRQGVSSGFITKLGKDEFGIYL